MPSKRFIPFTAFSYFIPVSFYSLFQLVWVKFNNTMQTMQNRIRFDIHYTSIWWIDFTSFWLWYDKHSILNIRLQQRLIMYCPWSIVEWKHLAIAIWIICLLKIIIVFGGVLIGNLFSHRFGPSYANRITCSALGYISLKLARNGKVA